MDAIGEIIGLLLFFYPGGLVRWLVSRLWFSKKKFSEFFVETEGEGTEVNVIVGLVSTIVVVVVIIALT